MSSEPDRNPSPPPELLANDEELLPDRIGNSVYSKQWVYKTLMKILHWCEHPMTPKKRKKETDSKEDADEGESKIESRLEGKMDMVELDRKVEDDSCLLWDMSTSREFVDFLFESDAPSIFMDIIDLTTSPRLLEIIVGVLGNMSSFDHICKAMSEKNKFRDSVILLAGTSDTPTLTQVLRVIHCGVSNADCQDLWFQSLEENAFMDNMMFIFQNSLSDSVIQCAFQLLYAILNERINYCQVWGQPLYIQAVIQAGNQLKKLNENLDNFFCVLCALCQYIPNVKELANRWMDFSLLFNVYITSISDDEEPLPDVAQVTSIASCFDSYNTLLQSEHMKRELVKIDINVLKAVFKLSSAISGLILNIKKNNLPVLDLRNPRRNQSGPFLRRVTDRDDGVRVITMLTEHEYSSWTSLADTIMELARTFLTYVEKENETEMVEDILNSEAMKENVSILII